MRRVCFHWKSSCGAEELTSGVATKEVERPTSTRVVQEEQYPKAVSEDHVDLFTQNHRRRTGSRPGTLSRHLIVGAKGMKDGIF